MRHAHCHCAPFRSIHAFHLGDRQAGRQAGSLLKVPKPSQGQGQVPRISVHEQKELKQWLKASSEKEEVNKALGISQHKENVKLKELAHDLER